MSAFFSTHLMALLGGFLSAGSEEGEAGLVHKRKPEGSEEAQSPGARAKLGAAGAAGLSSWHT
jgi:hypothetical protein